MSESSSRPDTTPSRHHGGWLWFWLPVALLLGGAAGYWLASTLGEESAARKLQQLKTQFDVVTSQNRYDYQVLKSKLDALEGQLLVEQSTRKSLEATLQATQEALGRARDQLAFFDRLLPPGPSGAISIRALDFQAMGPTLAYKVLLMRNAPGQEPFTGQLQFVAKGKLGDEPVELTLQPATAAAQSESGSQEVSSSDGEPSDQGPLALQFEQFQRSEGLLALPENFQPLTVTLNVLEGKTMRVSRSVSLPPGD